ncbi:hypothetical protein K2173_016764 [Erythroxylum novogranatense]|uniref:CCR4-NOT transcription complex subunit 4 n=1 Tax=Erythroxylum novogranatense TaxID=1862640 RepID=A0AAV8SHP5_9ROSI|nr:hypothetical protein K2173_016764 [Erythroxylum novogranatense]
MATMIDEGEKTCPLCTEEMDLTDQQLKPCKCGYEICVWCWHQIMDMAEKDDTEGRCPACRTAYDKEKIVGMAANGERLVAEVSMERKKLQKAKTKPSEGRKQLSSVRVIQRNLVYIVGLPLNLADEDLLQRREHFGQYGKVLKVSMSRTATGVIQQFPNNTCSVYITYSKEDEAIRCIQSVHGFVLDGRSLKACFGTTKYCHAWLRNVPCSNPDCLYLHEIGSEEDSFTKDEIISVYTRSRVQQVTGSTNSMLRRAGSVLPSPVDDYCVNGSVSAAKPIIKNSSNNTINSVKDSPPNGSSSRSAALPAAASWGMRASNHPLVLSANSNGATKPKPDKAGGTSVLSTPVASTAQVSSLHNNIGQKESWNEECQVINGKSKLDMLEPVKQLGADCRARGAEKLAKSVTASTVSVTSTSLSSKSDWGTFVTPNIGTTIEHNTDSCNDEDEIAITVGNLQKLASDMSGLRAHTNIKNEISGLIRSSSSSSEHNVIKSPEFLGLQHPFTQHYKEQVPLSATDDAALSVDGTSVQREQLDWRTNPQTQATTISQAEMDDIISFNNQRLKDPEFMSHTSLPNSANSLHVSSHYGSHSLQQNDIISVLENGVGDNTFVRAPTKFLSPNGYSQNLIGSLERCVERPVLLATEERKDIVRLQSEADSTAALHAGESSIISNILSLDLNSWDESLTSPQSLVKLLGENDRQFNSLQMPNSWKAQNNSQSRFSFARQDDSRNQDGSFIAFNQLPQNHDFSQDLVGSRNLYLDKPEMANGISSRNFEESESFSNSSSLFFSRRPFAGSRTQVSAPPGFSVPNRFPPPGFSYHERIDQSFDAIPGKHLLDPPLLRNSFQAPPIGNISDSRGIEFMDPAILAVGKGRLHGGINHQGLDMRSNFSQQSSTLEDEMRLQLLIQRSLSPQQNPGHTDVGDGLSSLDGFYGISSRLVDQSQVGNLSYFGHLSLPQSRNGITSNGHWDGWNDVQSGNNVAVTEFLRNERLGFNKFYAAGYDDSKFRMPSSGELYNRTFEM